MSIHRPLRCGTCLRHSPELSRTHGNESPKVVGCPGADAVGLTTQEGSGVNQTGADFVLRVSLLFWIYGHMSLCHSHHFQLLSQFFGILGGLLTDSSVVDILTARMVTGAVNSKERLTNFIELIKCFNMLCNIYPPKYPLFELYFCFL